MIRLYLVRHGQTKWNHKKLYQGRSDIELDEKGSNQAKWIADRLKNEKIDVIYCSELIRAKETASEINTFHNLPVVEDATLNERSYGEWEGLTAEEVREKFSEDYAAYKNDRYGSRPTNGESFVDIQERIKTFITTVKNNCEDKNVLIVAHNGTLRSLIGQLLNYDPEETADLYLDSTSLTIITIDENSADMELENSVTHLGGAIH